MIITENHNEMKKLVEVLDWDGFLEHIQSKYKHLDLYACSKDWYHSKRYICKFRGTFGDLIIQWK